MNKRLLPPAPQSTPAHPGPAGQWARSLAVLGLIAGLYGALGGFALLFLLIFVSLVMIGGLLLQTMGPRRVELVHTLAPDRPKAGGSAEVTVKLTFRSRLPIPWIMIEERWSCGESHTLLFPGFRRSFEYTYRLEGLTRGLHQLNFCKVSWGDLAGWFSGSCFPAVRHTFKVLPSPLYFGRAVREDGGYGLAGVLHRGRTESEDGGDIRHYVPGDPLNRVDWKSSARRGMMQTRVPDKEKARMLCIVLDHAASSYEPPAVSLPPRGSAARQTPGFELAVSAALGLLLAAQRSGSYAQLFTGGWPEGMAKYEGMGVIPPRVLDLLTEITPDGTRPLRCLLEDASRQWIPGMTAAVITGRLTRETALTLSKLLAHGVKVEVYYVWDEEASISASLGRLGADMHCVEPWHRTPREEEADEPFRRPTVR